MKQEKIVLDTKRRIGSAFPFKAANFPCNHLCIHSFPKYSERQNTLCLLWISARHLLLVLF